MWIMIDQIQSVDLLWRNALVFTRDGLRSDVNALARLNPLAWWCLGSGQYELYFGAYTSPKI